MRRRLLRQIPAPTAALAEALRDAYAAQTLQARRDADLRFTRAVLEASGHLAVTALFNTVERVIREVPGVAEAFYEDADAHREMLSAIVALVSLRDESRQAEELDRVFRAWDERAATRFRAVLAER